MAHKSHLCNFKNALRSQVKQPKILEGRLDMSKEPSFKERKSNDLYKDLAISIKKLNITTCNNRSRDDMTNITTRIDKSRNVSIATSRKDPRKKGSIDRNINKFHEKGSLVIKIISSIAINRDCEQDNELKVEVLSLDKKLLGQQIFIVQTDHTLTERKNYDEKIYMMSLRPKDLENIEEVDINIYGITDKLQDQWKLLYDNKVSDLKQNCTHKELLADVLAWDDIRFTLEVVLI